MSTETGQMLFNLVLIIVLIFTQRKINKIAREQRDLMRLMEELTAPLDQRE